MRFLLLFVLVFAATVSAKEIVATLDAPDDNISGLAWGNGSLWALDAVSDYVFQLDPSTGEVLSSFYFSHSASTVPTGLAYSESYNMLLCGGWYLTEGFVYKYTPTGEYLGMVDMCGG